jgi:hypothetical protein
VTALPVRARKSIRWRRPPKLISTPSWTRPSRWRAGAHAGAVEEIDGPPLDHAGTDATQHVLAAALLECDVGNAVLVQELAEEQARRAGPDDRYLGPHAVSSARDLDTLNTRANRVHVCANYDPTAIILFRDGTIPLANSPAGSTA